MSRKRKKSILFRELNTFINENGTEEMKRKR